MGLQFDTEKGDDLETIRKRLAEAAAWFDVASRLPDSGFPRSAECHPRHFEDNRKRTVLSVASDRRWALKQSGDAFNRPIEGRLLLYAPDENLSDGAAESASQGFFTMENEPPWDLWLGWVVDLSYFASTTEISMRTRAREYLVFWIPPAFVQAADDGIDVNPEACIEWLPELEHALGLRSGPPA
jgi:hypothetical protein